MPIAKYESSLKASTGPPQPQRKPTRSTNQPHG